jgi:excisionase family DNA binding protein
MLHGDRLVFALVAALGRYPMSGIDLEAVIELIAERIAERVVGRVVDHLAGRPEPGPELITMREFARRHSISETTVRAMIKDGRLDAVKIGAAVRVRANAQIGKPASVASQNRGDTPRARAAQILGRLTRSNS